MLQYLSGEIVQIGDWITTDDRPSVVVEVVEPATEQAQGYDCFDTGGILHTPNEGKDYFLEVPGDKSIVFVRRSVSDQRA